MKYRYILTKPRSIYATQPLCVYRLLFKLLLLSTLFANPASAKQNAPDSTHNAVDAEHAIAQTLQTLDNSFYPFSDKIYQQQAANLPEHQKNIPSIKDLTKAVKKLSATPNLAIATILANFNTLYRNIDSPDVSDIAWFLYKHNARSVADKLLAAATDNFSDYTASRVKYQKAKYYFNRGEWKPVIRLLQTTDIESALSQNDADYAYFITAVSLQKIHQHRDAMKVYEAIDENSAYYSAAQINKAVANIKQGWWTDAHLALDKAINKEFKRKNYALADRAELIKGFSEMQNEFYRNARSTFSQVGVDSLYVNRALQGMGLAALHQKDFNSALNAFTLLSNKPENDAYVQQAYLLMPYTQEKLGQKRLAEAKYTQASAYYQQKISQISHALDNEHSAFSDDVIATAQSINKTSDEYQQVSQKLQLIIPNFDHTLKQTLAQIDDLTSTTASTAYINKLQTFKAQYQALRFKSQVIELQQARATYQSYLNQCQYALARLYDENQ